MKRPLTGLAVLYAAGIWAGSMLPLPAELTTLVAALLLIVFLAVSATRVGGPVLWALTFVAGVFAYRHADEVWDPRDISRLVEYRDQNVMLRGLIVSDTGFRADDANASPEPDRMSFRLELESLRREGEWIPARGRVYVFVSEKRPAQPLRYGDVIECTALLRVPPPARNPGTLDWRTWLARQDIRFTATIRKSDACAVVAAARGNPVTALSLRLRERFERALHLGLTGEPQLAGVLAGMIIGERSEIPPDTYAVFQRTGVFHIFSVSGLNVTLVAAVIVMALRLVGVPRRWAGLIAIPALVLFVFATGGRPSAVRTLVMASVWLVGWALVRPTDMLNSLAAAALVILMWEPRQLFDGGFVLSFLVVLALIMLTPRLEAWLGQRWAADPWVAEPVTPRWRRMIEVPGRWLTRAVSGSVAAWVGLLPLMAVYFHLCSPVSIVANVIVVPLFGIITTLGMVSMLAHPVWPWLTLTFNNANFFLLSLMIRVVDWLGSVPFGFWFVREPPAWLTVGYYAVGALVLSRVIAWPRRRILVSIAAPALGAAMFLSFDREPVAEISVLDLTDGQAIFLNLPGEREDLLIDAGGDWSGRRVVVPFLRAQGVDRLAATITTRGDKSHVAGFADVLREMPVGAAIHSGCATRSRYYSEWLRAVREAKVPLQTVRAGDAVGDASPAWVHVLHPPRGPGASRSADNAVVLMVEHGPTRVLLMSDAGETVENALLASGVDLHATVMVKGRHEKEASATDAFLDAVRPETVVQVAGSRTPYRYPRSDTRERIESRGIRYLRTDETGAVTIRLTPAGYTVKTYLE